MSKKYLLDTNILLISLLQLMDIALMKAHKINYILTFNPDDLIKLPDIVIVFPNQVI